MKHKENSELSDILLNNIGKGMKLLPEVSVISNASSVEYKIGDYTTSITLKDITNGSEIPTFRVYVEIQDGLKPDRLKPGYHHWKTSFNHAAHLNEGMLNGPAFTTTKNIIERKFYTQKNKIINYF